LCAPRRRWFFLYFVLCGGGNISGVKPSQTMFLLLLIVYVFVTSVFLVLSCGCFGTAALVVVSNHWRFDCCRAWLVF
jgi:hypothetical protein